MATPVSSSSEREILCHFILDHLSSDTYIPYLSDDGLTIDLKPCPRYQEAISISIDNIASFRVVFKADFICVLMCRATGTRFLERFHYEDPKMFEKLTDALGLLSIKLDL